MAPQHLGCCGCPISMAIFSNCLCITSLFQSSSITRRKDGGEEDEDLTGKGNEVRLRTDTDTAVSTTAVAAAVIPPTSGIASDSQLPNSHEIGTNMNPVPTSMSSNVPVDAHIDALSNGGGEDKENPQISPDVAKKRRVSVPSDTDADDRPDADTCADIDDDTNGGGEEEDESPPHTSGIDKKRRVSFLAGFAEAVYDIPDRNEYDEQKIKDDLFYGDADYERFRASEQRRYDKVVAKKLQKLVMEKMQPSINEAVANGATLEDIEAMIPKTHAEMVAYMGGEENIRKLLAESSFSKLDGKEEKRKTIRSSRSSIVVRNTTTPTTPSDNNEENENKNEMHNENKNINEEENTNKNEIVKDQVSVGANTRKRTIRSSRSSIEITARKKGVDGRQLSISNTEADAAAASQELMAMIEEEEGEGAEDQKEAL